MCNGAPQGWPHFSNKAKLGCQFAEGSASHVAGNAYSARQLGITDQIGQKAAGTFAL
jgi:hypothetical protein